MLSRSRMYECLEIQNRRRIVRSRLRWRGSATDIYDIGLF